MRKQTMKVYHGIPKSVTDEHTIFYADFDGVIPQSPVTKTSTEAYGYSPTGYGILFPSIQNQTSTGLDGFSINSNSNKFTIDFWATMKSIVSSSYQGRLFVMYFKKQGGSTTYVYMERDSATNKFHVWCADNGGYNLVFGGFDFTSTNLNTPHHFRFVFKVGEYSKFYLDGKEMTDVTYHNILPKDIVSLTALNLGGKNFLISDVHISNIDRGDYFPNLPQDFIDGKAVIKPRMGQQQIKGDPMYSQVTGLKVSKDFKYYNTPQSDGTYPVVDNPELFIYGQNNWGAGTKLKVKGLNGEVISGVIDTDTALCKVVEYITDHSFIVDDITKLSVGDSFKMCHKLFNQNDAYVRTITDINTETNMITFDGSHEVNSNAISEGWNIVIETTASSSSPIVKTQDGTTVVGTWSGLGTNEATFTLGENADISGKDLYVTYALTMPSGNSDFPELPHTIERVWGENGVEMKPVGEILITDDFYGKITASAKECPHKSGWRYLSNINSSPSILGGEDDQSNYNTLYSSNGICRPIETGTNVYIPQHIFSFNLIEMIERKLGVEIPSTNKVQWLKDNLTSIYFNFYGYGICPSGNKVYVVNYFADTSTWNTSTWNHSNNSINKLNCEITLASIPRVIDSSGLIHFLIYTDTSTSSVQSGVYTDYVSINVILKRDSTYTTLYCENTRAREDKCNPVLIQKETKTVKRYLPSKECFVTECSKLPYKSNPKCEMGTILAVAKSKVLTTSGTASRVEPVNGVSSYADKIFLPTGYNFYNFDNSPIIMYDTEMASNLSHTIHLPIIRHWGGRRYHGEGSTSSGLDSCHTMTTLTDLTHTPRYEFFGAIKEVNGELKLLIKTDMRLPNNAYPPATYTNRDYILPNRPLIK